MKLNTVFKGFKNYKKIVAVILTAPCCCLPKFIQPQDTSKLYVRVMMPV